MRQILMLGTRKGLAIFDKKNDQWRLTETHFSGIPVSIAAMDEATGSWWACLDHGHWGCKLHYSKDQGKNWIEVETPKYKDGLIIKNDTPANLKYIWAFAQSEKSNKIFLGTEPGGLFESSKDNVSFKLNEPLWEFPGREEHWFGGGRDHAGIHSIVIDPRNEDHMWIGISCAGVYKSEDGGKSWRVMNKGLKANYLPNPDSEQGQDPHLLVSAKSNPDYLWQQNHCGIFKSEDGGHNWIDVSEKDGPANFGFAIAVSESDANRAWVVPCISDEIRVAIDQSLVVCRTDDGGKSWQSFSKGLPQGNSFDIVYRHSLSNMDNELAFGTTTGNLFYSDDYGESWNPISHYLPMVYSVEFYKY